MYIVPWEVFVEGFKLKSDEEGALKSILDHSNTGFVSQHKFSEFVRGKNFHTEKKIVTNSL